MRLARRAGSVPWRADVSNWLYAVAVRVARRARGRSDRQRLRERAAIVGEHVHDPDPGRAELAALIAAFWRRPCDGGGGRIACDRNVRGGVLALAPNQAEERCSLAERRTGWVSGGDGGEGGRSAASRWHAETAYHLTLDA